MSEPGQKNKGLCVVRFKVSFIETFAECSSVLCQRTFTEFHVNQFRSLSSILLLLRYFPKSYVNLIYNPVCNHWLRVSTCSCLTHQLS